MPSRSHGAVPHYLRVPNYNTCILTASKDPADQHHLTYHVHSLNGIFAPADALTYLTSSPYYRGTGCSPTPIAGGGQAAHMKTMHSACITTCRRSAVETRITNMNDGVITQEFGCRRGVHTSQYTELCARFNRRLDHGQARYGTRDRASFQRCDSK